MLKATTLLLPLCFLAGCSIVGGDRQAPTLVPLFSREEAVLVPTYDVSALASPTSTLSQEEMSVSTEQAIARRIHTQAAQTAEARPTFTPWPAPTQTESFENLPSLTPIPVSTPSGMGALVEVPPDILGDPYEIQNAYYFDTLAGRKRFEIYAGAIAGSGDEETAQGVIVVRVLQVLEQGGTPTVKIVESDDFPTPLQVGPVRIDSYIRQSKDDPFLIKTPLDYEFLFFLSTDVFSGQFLINPVPPRATLEIGGNKQLAGRGSFCWLSSCMDSPAIQTSATPLVAQSPVTAHLRLPLPESPDSLHLSYMKVSPPGSSSFESGYLSWSAEGLFIPPSEIPLQREQDLTLTLEAGYYVLAVSAAWNDYGDTDYGFLIHVTD